MESTILLRVLSACGLVAIIGLAWVLSENRKAVRWPLVAWGVGLQFVLGLIVLRTGFGAAFFSGVKTGFDTITAASGEGARFVFGNLSQFFLLSPDAVVGFDGQPVGTSPFPISAVIAFNVLPVIIFVSALSAMLQHLGVIQVVVRGMAWCMRRTLKTSGAETFGAALLVFLGIESVSALGKYLESMTRSEIFTLMTGFLATIAASVMVAYANFGAEPGHLLAASLMSAPAALVMAKLFVPETGEPVTSGTVRVKMEVESHNIFDAAARGAGSGLTMALNVGAMLMVFVGLIYLIDLGTVAVTGQTLTQLAGWVFRPFAFIMGVPWKDVGVVSELLATKSVFNEFLAYQQLGPMIQAGALEPRSVTITIYALCGFSNPGSLGIMIGGLAVLIPARRSEVAGMCLQAYAAGTLACFMTACVAGVLTAG
ncbi:MAG: NupC/NupG family nucleoside CNT transporter [Candidatus Hydrogenedentes bacterium]|nr:NupC/NupG family nucleoside CNT transporter [Candidatus Hydrogenedentota bacterium]